MWMDLVARSVRLTGIEREDEVASQNLAILEHRVEVGIGLSSEMLAGDRELGRVLKVDDRSVGRHGGWGSG